MFAGRKRSLIFLSLALAAMAISESFGIPEQSFLTRINI
jgi:hypothetical protein